MPPAFSERSTAFLQISSRSDLADWLGVSDKALRFILYKLSEEQKYSTFEIKKRNGQSRTIDAPSSSLKYLQGKISEALYEIAPSRQLAKGYIKGKSIFDHARLHRSKRWIVLADIDSFFPSINFGRVLGLFMARPFSFRKEVAVCLAQLCIKGDSLPQGAPTSPVISNIVCRRLDRQLLELAKRRRCAVSRYADDVCFSTNSRNISPSIAKLVGGFEWVAGVELRSIFAANGFQLNEAKFSVKGGRDRKLVTGLVVNEGVSVPRSWRNQLRSALHVLRKYGPESGLGIVSGWTPSFCRPNALDFAQVVRGKIRYVHWVDRLANRRVTASISRNFPSLFEYLPRLDGGLKFRLMSEGDTDLLHLEAALRNFQNNGMFLDLLPRYQNFPGDKGDAELWETLLRINKVDVDELTIGIFDCDAPAFMKKSGLVPGGFLKLGPKVYAMCLAAPNITTPEPFCIESLYPRAEATRTDSSSRRLFFRDEFDEATGLSWDGKFKRDYPKNTSVVLSGKVERVSDGASVLLSKSAFAANIHAEIPPFDSVSFNGFRPTLIALKNLVLEAKS